MKKIYLWWPLGLIAFLLLNAFTMPPDYVQDEQYTIYTNRLKLPPPDMAHHSIRVSQVIGWPEDKMPTVPSGFTIQPFASGLTSPRNIVVLPNADILIAEAGSANRITIIRPKNSGDGGEVLYRGIFLDELNRPYGMQYFDGYFYLALTDGLWRYAFTPGQLRIKSAGEKLLSLPKGGHWTRNITIHPQRRKIYIAIGSACNVGEIGMQSEVRRANILEVNLDGSGERVYASGLRNPVGMDWEPVTGQLWTVVNERDKLGDKLVPDFLTSVKEAGFYGWPYSYFGKNADPRWENDPHQEMVDRAIIPDVAVGSHTASLGLTFYNKKMFPSKYHGGAFVVQHGSWNRSNLVGYKMIFIPFKNGKPSDNPYEFMSGFIANEPRSQVYGRPVEVEVMPNGSLLVSDDGGGIIWMVSHLLARR